MLIIFQWYDHLKTNFSTVILNSGKIYLAKLSNIVKSFHINYFVLDIFCITYFVLIAYDKMANALAKEIAKNK